ENRAVLTSGVLVMLDAVIEIRWNVRNRRRGLRRIVQVELCTPFPDTRQVQRGGAIVRRRDRNGRVELGNRNGEELLARLRLTVGECGVVVHFARGNAIAVRLSQQDVRESSECLDFCTARIRRCELTETTGDEIGRRTSALHVLERYQRIS